MTSSISIAMSDDDVSKYIKNVILYEDFIKLSPSAIVNNLPFAILYLSSENYGHWTLLHNTIEGIEFFDPYGVMPDKQFEMIPEEFQLPHGLVDFLIIMSSKHNINYNQYQFQEFAKDVSTCGRWCCLREMMPCPIDTFAEAIVDVSTKLSISPDKLVSIIIN